MKNYLWQMLGAGLALVLVALAIPLINPAYSQSIASTPGLGSGKAGGAPTVHSAYQPGDVFAGVGTGLIRRYSLTGTLLDTLNTTSNSREQTGMCFDAAGNLFSTDFTVHLASKFDNSGTLLIHPWAGPFSTHPESCVFDSAGNVYTGEVDGDNLLRKFSPSGALLNTWAPDTETRGIDWIDLAADQHTIVYTSEGSSVKRFDVASGTQLPDLTTALDSPCYALRLRPNAPGQLMVTCAARVYLLDSTTGAILQTYTAPEPAPPTSYLFAMNLDPDGRTFWTAGYHTGNIYRYNITSTQVITTFTSPPNPYSLAGLAVYGEITAINPQPAPHPIGQTFGVPGGVPGHQNAAPYDLTQVNLATGNGVWAETDLSVPAPGLPLDWTRTYNSRDAHAGALGLGWSLSYAAHLDLATPAQAITATLEDGAQST